MYRQLSRIGKTAVLIGRYWRLAHRVPHLPLAEKQALMARFALEAGGILGVRVSESGTPLTGPCLITPNHISWHDVFAILPYMQPRFVAKAEVEHWPVFGFFGKQAGVLFINRGNRQAAQIIAEQMEEHLANEPVLVFPEGTTGSGRDMLGFKKRLFAPAIRARCPIQPVALYYYSVDRKGRPLGYMEESFATHAWRTLGTARIRIGIHFCEPFTPENNAHPREVAAEAERRVREAKAMLAANHAAMTLNDQPA